MGDQLFLSKCLRYYKRPEVQEAIVRHAAHREVSPRYGEGFGRRPDVLPFPSDVMAFAMRKMTSLHCSEERWENPLQIVTGMNRKEADELRIGWDFVLDIDAKDWEISRLTAWLFIQALRAHGIKGISLKFSGNKGWHIGVPWEAFPFTVLGEDGTRDIPTKDLFPELPRALAGYLIEYLSDMGNGLVSLKDDTIIFGKGRTRIKGSLSDLAKRTGKRKADLMETFCPACNRPVSAAEEKFLLLCGSCGHVGSDAITREGKELFDYSRRCPKCKKAQWSFQPQNKSGCPHDPKSYHQRFKLDAVVEIDTILLASRHLYRMPYSLHEKSGLVSVVIDPDDVLAFKKDAAKPEHVAFERTFLDRTKVVPGEAASLVAAAWKRSGETKSERPRLEFEVPDEAMPKEAFPPCITRIMGGLADGKKRAMFALTNFLLVGGWTHEMIEKELYEWNTRNPEPLREVVLKGHLRQIKGKRPIPPPNCKSFYQELGVCTPDQLCGRIKNPAQYTARLVQLGAGRTKRGRRTQRPDTSPGPQ